VTRSPLEVERLDHQRPTRGYCIRERTVRQRRRTVREDAGSSGWIVRHRRLVQRTLATARKPSPLRMNPGYESPMIRENSGLAEAWVPKHRFAWHSLIHLRYDGLCARRMSRVGVSLAHPASTRYPPSTVPALCISPVPMFGAMRLSRSQSRCVPLVPIVISVLVCSHDPESPA
jgi:hypothetical protein